MLDAYIIEQIKREKEKQNESQPELEIQPYPQSEVNETRSEESEKRGVVIIDFTI